MFALVPIVPIVQIVPFIFAFSLKPPQPSIDPAIFKNERAGALVTIAPSDHEITRQARQILRSPELVEYSLGLKTYDLNPTNPDKIFTYTSRHIDISKPGFALFAPSGRLIARGNTAPTREQIKTALDSAGIQTPIKTLRTFLQQHPNHIEARGQLIGLLRDKAIAQTKAKLDIDSKSARERMQDSRGEGVSVSFNNNDLPDTSSFQSKQLESEDDITIWAPYAQELDMAFNNGTWSSLIGTINDTFNYAPVEICSQTMMVLYRRHLPIIEETLVTLPGRHDLWSLWFYFAKMTDKSGGAVFLDSFPDMPPELRIQWPPPNVVDFFVKSAKEAGDWGLIRKLLDTFWISLKNMAAHAKFAAENPNIRIKTYWDINWSINYSALLESMLRTGSDDEAHEFVQAIKLSQSPQLIGNCIELAVSCERSDLAEQWRRLQ